MLKINSYPFISLIVLACINLTCKNTATNKPTKNHLARLALNQTLSETLRKNANPQYTHLLGKLDTVFFNDQLYRDVYDITYLKKNAEKQKRLDLQNQILIDVILDSFGYLNSKDVGIIGQKAINLTLLHANHSFKLKYLPLVEDAFKEKRMFVNTYASFIDKFLIEEKKLQKYGTQLTTFKNKTMYYPINIDSMAFYRNTLGKNSDTTNLLDIFPRISISNSEYKKLLPELIEHCYR